MQNETATLTTADLLARYNTLYNKSFHGMHKDEVAAEVAEMEALALAIIEGDLSGAVPTKKEQLDGADLPAVVSPRPINAPKAKLTPLQAAALCVSDDILRPAMCGVRVDAHAQAAVATNGHILVSLPYAVEGESKTLHPVSFEELKAGDKIGRAVIDAESYSRWDRYPDYQNVIPVASPNGPDYTITDIQALRNSLAGMCRANRFIRAYLGLVACIMHAGTGFYFQPEYLATVLKAMQATGSKTLHVYLSTPNRAMVLRDADNPAKLGLVMPVQYIEGQRPYSPLLDTATSQAEMPQLAPAKLKRAPKKPAAPRAVRVLNAEEKKSLSAHVKRYNAESETEKARLMGLLHDCLNGHISRLRSQQYRQEATTITQDLFWARVARAMIASIAPSALPPPAEQPTTSPADAALPERTTDELRASILQRLQVQNCPAEWALAAELAEADVQPNLQPEPCAAPAPTNPAVKPYKPFEPLRKLGLRPTTLHQIGKCAVALLAGVSPPEYLAAYRHLRCAGPTPLYALAGVRKLYQQHTAQEAELLRLADAVPQGLLTPQELQALCEAASLAPEVLLPRAKIRQALTAKRTAKTAHYLHVLSRLRAPDSST